RDLAVRAVLVFRAPGVLKRRSPADQSGEEAMPLSLRLDPRSSRRALLWTMAGLALLAVITPAITQPPPAPAVVSGVVFLDRNENGVRDPGERGLADVSVSDGKVT